MAELEWLITDKFKINSAGKTPQARRVESASMGFSSRMIPSALAFDACMPSPKEKPKSPLKSIENNIRNSPISSTRTDSLFCVKNCLNYANDIVDSTKSNIFSNKNSPNNLSPKDYANSPKCYAINSPKSYLKYPTVSKESPSTKYSSSSNVFKSSRLDQLSDDKENFDATSVKMDCYNGDGSLYWMYRNDLKGVFGGSVRTPTRMGSAALESPLKRKPIRRFGLMESDGRTPSKFSVVRNSLDRSPLPSTWRTPVKPSEVVPNLDFASRDSGFENSSGFEDVTKTLPTIQSSIRVPLSEPRVKFEDDITESACHFDTITSKSTEDFNDRCSVHFANDKDIRDYDSFDQCDETLKEFGHCDSDMKVFGRRKEKKDNRYDHNDINGHCSKKYDDNDDDFSRCEDKKISELSDYEFDTLHDLEEEFESTEMPTGSLSKYEVISTDSPDVNSRYGHVGRIFARNFEFGSPIGDVETSENFSVKSLPQKIPRRMPARTETTRMLNFDVDSPAASVDSGLAVPSTSTSSNDTEIKPRRKVSNPFAELISPVCSRYIAKNKHLKLKKADNGAISIPPGSRRSRLFDSISTGSIESGCISETDDYMLFDIESNDINESRNVPSSFQSLISHEIKGKIDLKTTTTTWDKKATEILPDEDDAIIAFDDNDSELKPSEEFLSSDINEEHKLKQVQELRTISDKVLKENRDALNACRLILDEGSPDLTAVSIRRPTFRRSMSLTQASDVERVRTTLFGSPARSLKRAEGLHREEDGEIKRRRGSGLCSIDEKPSRPVLHRAMSDNEASIKMALARSYSEPDLIGDFSAPFLLPLVVGQHTDLRSICSDTLAQLIQGKYSDHIATYQIIDCRYPYEFEGGHIMGALNLHTEELVRDRLLADAPPSTAPPTNAQRRSILVFHCEFSTQRGPKLSRYLRACDRALHRDWYPHLAHPELYLLAGGYCAFRATHGPLCRPTPGAYTPMNDPKHAPTMKALRARQEQTSRKPVF